MKLSKISAVWKRIKTKARPVIDFLKKYLNDWSIGFAAMLAFDLLIALFPLSVATFGVLGLLLRNDLHFQRQVTTEIINLVPSGNSSMAGIRQIVDLALNQLSHDAGALLVIGILFALFGASRLFISLDQCMCIIYRLPERNVLRQNLLAFVMLFIFIILIPPILLINSTPSLLAKYTSGLISDILINLGGFLVSLLIGFILCQIIYYFIPNKRMSIRETWCGALFASIALQLFVLLFPVYVKAFMNSYAGQIGFVIILILFLFYFAIILLLGAQINAFFFEKCPPFEEGLGTYLSEMHMKYGQQLPTPRISSQF